MAAWVRWGLSLTLALGCLAAISRLALPPAGAGGGAPEARLELVRLEERNSESSAVNGSRVAMPAAAPAPAAPAPPVPAVRAGAPAESSPPRERITRWNAAVAVEMPQTASTPDIAALPPSDADSKGPQTPSSAAEPTAKTTAKPTAAGRLPTEPTTEPPTGAPPTRAAKRMRGGAAVVFDRPGAAAEEARADGADSEAPGREVAADRLDAGFALLRPVRLAYPSLAKRLGKAGAVRLELGIDPEGRVYRVNVLEQTGVWGFGRSVEQAYRAARFTHPTVRGRPVSVLWRKTVIFRP